MTLKCLSLILCHKAQLRSDIQRLPPYAHCSTVLRIVTAVSAAPASLLVELLDSLVQQHQSTAQSLAPALMRGCNEQSGHVERRVRNRVPLPVFREPVLGVSVPFVDTILCSCSILKHVDRFLV